MKTRESAAVVVALRIVAVETGIGRRVRRLRATSGGQRLRRYANNRKSLALAL